ncbi:MAG: cytotoxic translational repressor of toxin-antitoxin stability system [Lacisediminihabitans sp.]
MTKRPAPTRQLHEKLRTVEKWTLVTDARGRAVGHHETYKLITPSGDVLRTRISHPVNRTTYAPAMWSHILRDQLQVTAREFWSCVLDGVRPDRGAPVVPDAALPLHLVARLVRERGLSREDTAGLSAEEVIQLLK